MTIVVETLRTLDDLALFERLLGTGYLLVGLVHEGGRSFQLLVREDRAGALGRS
jgi:hypothetical protein